MGKKNDSWKKINGSAILSWLDYSWFQNFLHSKTTDMLCLVEMWLWRKKNSLHHSCPKHVVIGKKIPSQSNDKFVNYSQQRTIFHWNWKEILRFVGFITWLTLPIQPKLVEISVGVPPALQQTSIFLFSFNEKWLYGDYI